MQFGYAGGGERLKEWIEKVHSVLLKRLIAAGLLSTAVNETCAGMLYQNPLCLLNSRPFSLHSAQVVGPAS